MTVMMLLCAPLCVHQPADTVATDEYVVCKATPIQESPLVAYIVHR